MDGFSNSLSHLWNVDWWAGREPRVVCDQPLATSVATLQMLLRLGIKASWMLHWTFLRTHRWTPISGKRWFLRPSTSEQQAWMTLSYKARSRTNNKLRTTLKHWMYQQEVLRGRHLIHRSSFLRTSCWSSTSIARIVSVKANLNKQVKRGKGWRSSGSSRNRSEKMKLSVDM